LQKVYNDDIERLEEIEEQLQKAYYEFENKRIIPSSRDEKFD